MATRKKFSPEYKHEALQLAESSDQSVSQVARDLGISPNILSRWCREAKVDGKKAFPGGSASHAMRRSPISSVSWRA